MAKSKKINIQGKEINIIAQKENDFISLTDMARRQLQEDVIIKWLSLKSTIVYFGEWEALYNPDFNYTEFGTIRNFLSGSNSTPFIQQNK
ncbi:MAG: KilA-N domain-containing protein [Bacteroidetes bacterium]|nr:MAG: KilA-N domain-containing protein [Bacteroidota bacterium]